MTNQVSDQAEAKEKHTATFYVVPLLTVDTGTQVVLYYQKNLNGGKKWQAVLGANLDAGLQGQNIARAKLLQPLDVNEISAHTGLAPSTIDINVRLYGAVVKTLQGSDEFKDMYSLDHAGDSITIDVKQQTKRGVILVFAQNGVGDSSSVIRLIASTDPEIKNSTGGNTDCP